MGIYQETLWKKLEEKAHTADVEQPEPLKCEHAYLSAIKAICTEAVTLTKTIRDMFPLYTLHDEVHICNVMRLMEKLLGDDLESLSRDETAMLVLAACCHDIGMSCSTQQLEELLDDRTRLEQYLEDHPDAYMQAQGIADLSKLPDDLLRDFLRTIHPERVSDILRSMDWPDVLQGKVNRLDLISVCQSHGESVDKLLELNSEYGIDLRMCAVLLRLADILDFDTSRAPKAVYRYSGFDHREDSASKFSREEWEKHQASHGFSFEKVTDRSFPYDLPYHATCPSMQIEQAVNSYLDWVDRELTACQNILRYCNENWRGLVLPRKIARRIDPEGYLSGQFCLTMDQDQVLELLVGKNLYQDPGVFVRELLQNAIDAVRTRQQLDRNLPRTWRAQINIRCWMDEEGYHWFRIEDNGTGMNEDIIKKYFLKVGCSYYTSNDFRQEKHRCQADEDYMPISRFGIGILSCFMGDKAANQVEVSTKHFSRGSNALRMSMHGTSGYYYLANRQVCPRPSPMKGISQEEKRPYRSEAGTVIAVRVNLFQSGTYQSFREILDKYVVYPMVPVHYEDEQGSFDYPTEQDLMKAIHSINPSQDPDQRGVLEFSPTDEQILEAQAAIPGLKFYKKPVVTLKCIALDECTESPYLSGAVLLTKLTAGTSNCTIRLGTELVEPKVCIDIRRIDHHLILNISLSFPDAFRKRMNLCESQQIMMSDRLRALLLETNSPLEQEIIKAVNGGFSYNSDWLRQTQTYYKISKAELLNKVKAIRSRVMEHISTATDMSIYYAYKNVYEAFGKEKYTISLCNLNTLPWYRQYFASNCKNENHISLAAHNGVLCGNANFFVKSNMASRSEPTEVILLLKDYYRPEVDIARTGVKKIPLEAAVELEILRKEWNQQNFTVFWGNDSLTYRMIPQKTYCKLIEKRPDLVSRLYFQTDKGKFRAEELSEKLQQHGQLVDAYYFMDRQLYSVFSMAYLQKEFRLVGKRRGYAENILLLPKAAAMPHPNIENFPPCLFLPVEGDNESIHLRLNHYWRFYDEAHPLSKFLIDNQEQLEKMVPGLFQGLIRSLISSNNVISEVNTYLKQIQSLPQGRIRVPANAFLTQQK